MAARKNFTSVGLDTATRDAISMQALTLSAEIGKRISIGEVIRAAFQVSMRHRAQLVKELTTTGEESP
ncbi:MAG: hypothetical protein JWO67_4123 [Streptosporangiaceae bacterium]|nr:hypothetical protein [Streptosporangiaceae bacterium]